MTCRNLLFCTCFKAEPADQEIDSYSESVELLAELFLHPIHSVCKHLPVSNFFAFVSSAVGSFRTDVALVRWLPDSSEKVFCIEIPPTDSAMSRCLQETSTTCMMSHAHSYRRCVQQGRIFQHPDFGFLDVLSAMNTESN